MRRASGISALLGAAVAAGLLAGAERDARACGGCFTPPAPPTETESVITDEKMMLAISTTQTTLYDQINYSGSPASFAWVLPIKGQVTVGLSADVMFQVINQLTVTEVQAPPTNCPPAPNCYGNFFGPGGGGATAAAGEAADAAAAVTVTSQKQVGPYETVQLHSTDGSALTNWLTAHGYQIPDSTKPIINAYVAQSFDFLALKLVPGEGVQSMQPVRVTSQGAAPSLPLHMVAVGTGPTTGITIWVVADGRWAPSNFPTFTIADSEIRVDWLRARATTRPSGSRRRRFTRGRGGRLRALFELSQYTIQQALLNAAEYDPTGGDLAVRPSMRAYRLDGGAIDGATGDAAAGGDAGGDDASDDSAGDAGAQAQRRLGRSRRALRGHHAAQRPCITWMCSDARVVRARGSTSSSARRRTSPSSRTSTSPSSRLASPSARLQHHDLRPDLGTAPRSQAEAAQASAGGSSGCSTTQPQNDTKTTLAILFALGGVAAFRIRRKRRASP